MAGASYYARQRHDIPSGVVRLPDEPLRHRTDRHGAGLRGVREDRARGRCGPDRRDRLLGTAAGDRPGGRPHRALERLEGAAPPAHLRIRVRAAARRAAAGGQVRLPGAHRGRAVAARPDPPGRSGDACVRRRIPGHRRRLLEDHTALLLRPRRVRARPERLRQALHVLCGSPYPWARGVAAVRGDPGRGGPPGRVGLQLDHPARPERQLLRHRHVGRVQLRRVAPPGRRAVREGRAHDMGLLYLSAPTGHVDRSARDHGRPPVGRQAGAPAAAVRGRQGPDPHEPQLPAGPLSQDRRGHPPDPSAGDAVHGHHRRLHG